MTTLYTIGYQGQVIESFIGQLNAAGVALIIDVRQLPLSRKPGFSKHKLAGNLHSAGIGYTHCVDLGTPAALRQEVRRSKDYAAFFQAYRAHLLQAEPALHAVLPLIHAQCSCLLCFEQQSQECHRLVVAQELARLDGRIEVVHL